MNAAEEAARRAREQVRSRERAVWSTVERSGRDLRQSAAQAQAQSQRQGSTTKADEDAGRKPREAMGV